METACDKIIAESLGLEYRLRSGHPIIELPGSTNSPKFCSRVGFTKKEKVFGFFDGKKTFLGKTRIFFSGRTTKTTKTTKPSELLRKKHFFSIDKNKLPKPHEPLKSRGGGGCEGVCGYPDPENHFFFCASSLTDMCVSFLKQQNMTNIKRGNICFFCKPKQSDQYKKKYIYMFLC